LEDIESSHASVKFKEQVLAFNAKREARVNAVELLNTRLQFSAPNVPKLCAYHTRLEVSSSAWKIAVVCNSFAIDSVRISVELGSLRQSQLAGKPGFPNRFPQTLIGR